MLRIALVVLCLMGPALAGAGMPEVGDYVAITQSIGIIERQTYGTVLDLDPDMGVLLIDRDYVYQRSGYLNWTEHDMPPENVTIGIQTIIAMRSIPV